MLTRQSSRRAAAATVHVCNQSITELQESEWKTGNRVNGLRAISFFIRFSLRKRIQIRYSLEERQFAVTHAIGSELHGRRQIRILSFSFCRAQSRRVCVWQNGNCFSTNLECDQLHWVTSRVCGEQANDTVFRCHCCVNTGIHIHSLRILIESIFFSPPWRD